jgi:hypothetical protein
MAPLNPHWRGPFLPKNYNRDIGRLHIFVTIRIPGLPSWSSRSVGSARVRREIIMLKSSTVLALATLAAAWGSAPATAALTSNALAANALAANALAANALAANALAANGLAVDFVTLQTVRLVLPDGSEMTFR